MKKLPLLIGAGLLTGCTIVLAPEPKLMADLSHLPVCRTPESQRNIEPPAPEDPVMQALREMSAAKEVRGKLLVCSQILNDYACEPKDLPKSADQPLQISVEGSRAILMFPETFSVKQPERMERADQSVWMKQWENYMGLETDALEPNYDFSVRMAGREIRIIVTHIIGQPS